MPKTHIPSLGAIRKNNGQYVSPIHANKQDTFICPTCNKDLVFCKGRIRIPYFRHVASDNPCNHYNHPGESELHKDAKNRMKELLLQRLTLTFLRICKTCKKNEEYVLDAAELLESSIVSLEHSFNYLGKRKQADVAIVNGPDDDYPISFEICNTHSTSEEERPEPWFEIDALTLINLTNLESFHRCIPCSRTLEMCDECMDKNNNTIIEKCRKMESLKQIPKNNLDLEHYIRYKLGQREFNIHRKVKIIYDFDLDKLCRRELNVSETYPPGLHAKFDFDTQYDDDANNRNDSLMNRFSQFMGNMRFITIAWKGAFYYKIVHTSTYDNKYRYSDEFMDDVEDCYGLGTVEIILGALCNIRKSYTS